MKLLLSTPVFAPLIGGMETMALNLAQHFADRGVEVHVVTRTPFAGVDDYSFKVSRGLSSRDLQRAVENCDLVLSNGAGLYAAPYAVVSRKPLIFMHANYQVSSVEGAGFIYGQASPLNPYRSILFHLGKRKSLRRVLRDGPKMLLTRFFAKHLASANVAISDWMAMRQPLPRQVRIHNPFPITRFVSSHQTDFAAYEYSAVFLGRLTPEKGVDTLLQSLPKIVSRHPKFKLLVIGDGAFRTYLEQLSEDLGVLHSVHFVGSLTGEPLVEAVRSARLAIVPSLWEEPFGGVTTELLAAGKPMVVSERGALAEIVGDAGITFPNGDAEALAATILKLLAEPELQTKMRAASITQVGKFDEITLIDQYMKLFELVLSGNRVLPSNFDARA